MKNTNGISLLLIIIIIVTICTLFLNNAFEKYKIIPLVLIAISLCVSLAVFYFTCGERKNFFLVIFMIIGTILFVTYSNFILCM